MGKESIYIILHFPPQSIIEKKLEQKLKEGTEAKATEGTTYWAASNVLLSSFLYKNHLLRRGIVPSTVGWDPHIIINQEKAPRVLPTGQSDGDNSSIETPAFQIYLGFCKVDFKKIHKIICQKELISKARLKVHISYQSTRCTLGKFYGQGNSYSRFLSSGAGNLSALPNSLT